MDVGEADVHLCKPGDSFMYGPAEYFACCVCEKSDAEFIMSHIAFTEPKFSLDAFMSSEFDMLPSDLDSYGFTDSIDFFLHCLKWLQNLDY